ncbi:hypothetical protein B296_00026519 [Ensete ventricosum]|uniref:Uncharacterized protein n=1 Tax=Ensete ventricosum TaxID=4639 RepID=A0A426Z0V0_ENSVE|nr:hypothetical protein B296_00026519 [Ensete ventricosum]
MPQCCHSSCHEENGAQQRLCWCGIEAQDLDNDAPTSAKSVDFESYWATGCPKAMLHPGVTQEWVGKGELPKQRTQSEVAEALRCAGRSHTWRDQGLWIQGVNVMVQQRQVYRVCASNLASDESLGHQQMGVVIESMRALQQDGGDHAWELQFVFPSTKGNCSVNTGVLKQTIKRSEEAMTSPEGLSYPKAKRRSERRCKVMDSRAIGLATPWYYRGGTSVESSIPCSHRGRVLVVKGTEEVENTKANSKYQDKAEVQRPRNFIRPVSIGFSSR